MEWWFQYRVFLLYTEYRRTLKYIRFSLINTTRHERIQCSKGEYILFPVSPRFRCTGTEIRAVPSGFVGLHIGPGKILRHNVHVLSDQCIQRHSCDLPGFAYIGNPAAETIFIIPWSAHCRWNIPYKYECIRNKRHFSSIHPVFVEQTPQSRLCSDQIPALRICSFSPAHFGRTKT